MPETPAPNYPDILGYVTDGERMTINMVEFALAVRPPVVHAGRPLEAILLMQNIADINVTVTATLQLPPRDANRQPQRFIAKNQRLTITLRPAEVGFISLPILSLPDTAVGNDYKIGVDVEVNPHGKPRRIRWDADKAEINLQYYFFLSEDALVKLAELKKLKFSTARRRLLVTGMLGGSPGIEAHFRVVEARPGKMRVPGSRWVSVWTLEHTDVRPLLERYSDLLVSKVLHRMHRYTLFEPLFASTQKRIQAAGYDIQPAETLFIVKLLTSIVEMSMQAEAEKNYPGEEIYRIGRLLQKGWPTDGSPIPLPNWCRAFLYTIGFDERVLQDPVSALAGPLYGELIRDGVIHGFEMIHHTTGEELGTAEEIREYAERLVQAMWHPDLTLSFLDVYLPLVLAGILSGEIDKKLVETSRTPFDYLHQVTDTIRRRKAESYTGNEQIFKIADEVIELAFRKYGYY